MRFQPAIFNYSSYILIAVGITLNFILDTSKSQAAIEFSSNQSLNQTRQNLSPTLASVAPKNLVASKLPVLPELIDLVKNFEGFRAAAYLDTSGLPVIGYGQTRINGRTVTLGQYITQAQADIALEQELYHIQRLVKAQVKVELNPYQLGALSSLVYNAGTTVITDSTLIRKLNAGDYGGAAKEFPRWNKANQGGRLVVFPGLTKRRLAEQKLFLTKSEQVISNK